VGPGEGPFIKRGCPRAPGSVAGNSVNLYG